MRTYFLTLFLLFFSILSFSQKIEKETRIASEKVPTKALEFIFLATESPNIKWYYEKNEVGNSYEAKFFLKKSKISAEFDLNGELQDVEVEIKKSKIPPKVKKASKKYLKIYFNKYRILKVQTQFRGESKDIREKIKDSSILTSTPTFYEIVVIGKKIDNVYSTEFLFDVDGNLISSKKLVVNNSDHLAY